MLVSRAEELSPCSSSTLTLTSSCTFLSALCSSNPFLSFPMRSSLSFLRSLSLSLSHYQPHHFHRQFFFRAISTPLSSSSPKPQKPCPFLVVASASSSHSTFVKHLACEPETNENWDFNKSSESEAGFDFDKNDGYLDLKYLPALSLDVKELEELPEQRRRSKLAWFVRNCRHIRPEHLFGYSMRKRSERGKLMLLMLPCIACGFVRMRLGLR